METRFQRLIRETLKESGPESDHRLDAQAYERAMSGRRPRSMTAFVWVEWQGIHGNESGSVASAAKSV